jgi:hypothetical protein
VNLNHHRRARPHSGPARKAVRLGLLATAGLTVIATAASAEAATTGGALHGIAVADDSARTLASPGQPSEFQDSFTVHQEGALFDSVDRNQASAESAACTAAKPCRSIALSFQIVTMAGENIRLNASNVSNATDHECAGCQTFAGAWQFIVSTPSPFTLSASAQRQLADIHRRLDALGKSTAPVSVIQSQAEALAAQVQAVLSSAAATAPKGPGVDVLAQMAPTVTMHRMLSA